MQFSFCQENYPKKQIREGDTVVVITPLQLSVINGIIQDRNGYRQLVTQLDSVMVLQDSLILSQKEELRLYKDIERKNEETIRLISEGCSKRLKSKNMQIWITGGVCLVVGLVAGLLIGR